MPLINILILEKDSSFASSLKIALKKWSRVEVVIFKNIAGALKHTNKHNIDLLIVNTFLEEKGDGIAFGKQVANHSIPLIYISENGGSTIYDQAKQLNLLAFLVKPFDFKTLMAALNIYFDDPNNFLIFKKGKEKIRLRFLDIQWIKSSGNYCIIKTNKGEYSLKSSLTNLRERYLDESFIQIHRAFIVRVDKIQGIHIKTNTVDIEGEKLPIGRKYRKAFFEQIDVI